MIDNKSIQEALAVYKHYVGKIDGLIGPATHAAIRLTIKEHFGIATDKWPASRMLMAFQQMMMRDVGLEVGAIDGLMGPQTKYALELWQNRLRNIPGPPLANNILTKWPTQLNVNSYYGNRGENQTLLTLPYQFYLYDTKQKVSRISLHSKVASSAERVLTRVLTEYGEAKINELHLNRYFGSLNVRKMRGSNSWSMHSWGIAIDFDANRNQLRWGRDQAAFAKPAYDKWWTAWEAEGWISLGRKRNYDWMHVQAAAL